MEKNFESLNEIDKGPHGCIYLLDVDGKQYAAKRIKGTHIDSKKFESTFSIMEKLRSPYLIVYKEYFKDGNDYIVIMEYRKGISILTVGGSLRSYINEKIKLKCVFTEETILKYLHEIAKGLRYLHAMKAAHLDLKLENVLLNESKRAQLTDYGLFFENTEMVETDRHSKEAADIWALGCIAYQLCYLEVIHAIMLRKYMMVPMN